MKTIPHTSMPDPATLVSYPDGSIACAMFHYATEGDDARLIAKEHGYTSIFILYDDEQTIEESEKPGFLTNWHPEACLGEGWIFAGKFLSEDGPMAVFIMKENP